MDGWMDGWMVCLPKRTKSCMHKHRLHIQKHGMSEARDFSPCRLYMPVFDFQSEALITPTAAGML